MSQIRRDFGASCTNSYTSEKTPSSCPLNASRRGAENAADAPQVFSATAQSKRSADGEADATGFWNVVYKQLHE